MNRILVFALAFVPFGFAPLLAQNPQRQAGAPGAPGPQAGGEVQGSVVDDAGAALYGASVAVWSTADSSIVGGDIAHQDGAFRVQGLPPGTYYLQITSIGYDARRTADFTVGPSSPRADVGVIRMIPSPVAVEGIDVTVEKPTVAIEPDRNSYAAKDIAPAASTASEVLASVPAVLVDQDGKVSLRGNENVAVHINGRPAPIRGDQLGAYLQQLPANVVDRIEVIPTPSARYDPEGMAGIINIVLKQNTDLGMSGGLTLTGSPSDRYNTSATLGYQRGAFTSFSSYGFNSNERNVDGINDRERFDELSDLLSVTEQDFVGDNTDAGHNLSSTIDYRVNDRDVLTNVFSLNRRGSDEQSLSAVTEFDSDQNPIEEYDRLRDAETDGLVLDYTLAFKRTIEPRVHELATEVRLNRNSDNDFNLLWRQPENAGEDAARTEVERTETDALTRQLTAQVDYTRPMGESLKLEAGYKGNARWLDRDFLVLQDDLGTGVWTPSDLSNTFDFEEHVEAAYGVLTRAIGALELQGGLRIEYATRDFVLSDESFPYSYWSTFPSAAIRYTLNDADEARLSFSRRIRRPGTQELNPFPVFFDTQNVFIGNPELTPEYTNALELSLSHQANWGSLQLSPFYRRTSDVIRFIVDTDDVIDGREVTSVSFENLENGDSWGTDANASLQIGGWLNGMASFSIFKMVTDGGSETSLSSNAVTWST
ncbi:MAG TPA: TonB-dependent receptor, partial [Gemmatimonadota bacterium]|nr:TonB-dependent receptor [Gemmatimonadota bacterium]